MLFRGRQRFLDGFDQPAIAGHPAHFDLFLAGGGQGQDGLAAIVSTCIAKKITGLIVSNTTIARPDSLRGRHKSEVGGLSGAPLLASSTAMLARAYRLAGKQLMLIGVGGIFEPEDVMEKILAGASLVQVYTGFAYQGPAMIPRLKTGLAMLLRARGFASVTDAIGAGA